MSEFILSGFADEIGDDLKIQMDTLDMLGIKHIEIRGVNGRNITEYPIQEVKRLRQLLDSRGFGISAVGSPIGKQKITDDFTPHFDLFRHTVEIAEALGTRYIRAFSFFIPEGEDPLSFRDEVMERWFRFISHVKGTDMILLHENEKHIFGDTPERCADLMDTMKSGHLRATFDPANFIQCGIEPFPYAYSLLKENIVYVHIKDARLADRFVVPSGQGDGRIADLLDALRKDGYSGYLSLEPHLGSFTGLAALEQGPVAAGLPEGGPRQFAAAFKALKKILDSMEPEAM